MGVKISTGREIAFDFNNVTRAEYRDAMNPRGTLEAEDIFLSKLTGLSLEDLANLSVPDFQLLFTEALKAKRAGITPNSQSAST